MKFRVRNLPDRGKERVQEMPIATDWDADSMREKGHKDSRDRN